MLMTLALNPYYWCGICSAVLTIKAKMALFEYE